MRPPTFILGYHGCDRDVGEPILAGHEHISLSENSYDWLGSGAYFWEDDPLRAQRWAETVADNSKHFKQRIKEPFVIGAVIELGSCLDLGNSASLEEIKEAHRLFCRFWKSLEAGFEFQLPVNESGYPGDIDRVKRHLDCAVINFVHHLREMQNQLAYDTVRAAFPEGPLLYEGACIQAKTHVQVCVRDPKRSIRGYFRVPS